MVNLIVAVYLDSETATLVLGELTVVDIAVLVLYAAESPSDALVKAAFILCIVELHLSHGIVGDAWFFGGLGHAAFVLTDEAVVFLDVY